MLTSSKFRFFGQFLNVVGSHSNVKRRVTYIYSEITFYLISYPFHKTQKTNFVLEKQTFQQYPKFCWFFLTSAKIRQAMANELYTSRPHFTWSTRWLSFKIRLLSKLDLWHGAILPHPERIQGPKSPGEIGLNTSLSTSLA